MSTDGPARASASGGLYAAVGIALFTIGGMVLEDAYGSDGLTFLGFSCLASGLVCIVSAGVALGSRSRQR